MRACLWHSIKLKRHTHTHTRFGTLADRINYHSDSPANNFYCLLNCISSHVCSVGMFDSCDTLLNTICVCGQAFCIGLSQISLLHTLCLLCMCRQPTTGHSHETKAQDVTRRQRASSVLILLLGLCFLHSRSVSLFIVVRTRSLQHIKPKHVRAILLGRKSGWLLIG